MIPLITIEGPTASGKTALALALATALNSQIISADSRQVYNHLNIGTAKPSPEQLNLVHHHLIDFLDPRDSYNAGSFAKDAGVIIKELFSRGKIPIVCGGTGMYVQALLEGLCELPPIDPSIRKALRKRLEKEGLASLHSELVALDPVFAGSINPNDPQRTLRGLEVYHATGVSLSRFWELQSRSKRYNSFRILIDPLRDHLYQRINTRASAMVASGLTDEVKQLTDSGYTWSDPGMNTLGYKEFQHYFTGVTTIGEVVDSIAQHTRNYAKRQCTWYRKHKFDLTIASPEVSISLMLDSLKASGQIF